MKRFINDAETAAAESLDGFVAAHNHLVVFGPGKRFVRRRVLSLGKVAVISGGGAGHEPMHAGFVGAGMLDAACTGHLFTSPTPDQIAAAISETDTGAGCVLVVKNYDGDVMNFEIAAEMAGKTHRLELVIVGDDVATLDMGLNQRGRGLAGTLIVEKIIGAAADAGLDLKGVAAVGRDVSSRTRTLGASLDAIVNTAAERLTSLTKENEVEFGIGIHGEKGRSRELLHSADAICEKIADRLLEDIEHNDSLRSLLFVNGLGGTSASELYLMFQSTLTRLRQKGVNISRSLVGSFVTSLNTHGVSITLTRFDEEQMRLWDMPVCTAALHW